jgi:Arc/MetJ-type ribon-helix-helix transcriptional regulator
MKQVVHDLIQAVRNLGLEVTEEPSPKCVRVSITSTEFWSRMKELQLALEAVDRDGADKLDVEAPHPKDNPEKLKIALDGLMRLYQIKGGSLEEASEVIRNALELTDDQEKQNDNRNTFDILPNFAPSKLKRARRYKPRLNLVPEKHSSVSFNQLRRMNFEVLHAQSLLGATFRADPVPQIDAPAPGLGTKGI